jgi:PadR family transcriptional regulator PadR
VPARRHEVNGQLDLLLLATIAASPRHGYAIISHLREQSGGRFDMQEGTVYPALHRLEELGVITSRSESVSGRRRRVYELTPAGAEALLARREAWSDFAAGVSAVLGLAT